MDVAHVVDVEIAAVGDADPASVCELDRGPGRQHGPDGVACMRIPLGVVHVDAEPGRHIVVQGDIQVGHTANGQPVGCQMVANAAGGQVFSNTGGRGRG